MGEADLGMCFHETVSRQEYKQNDSWESDYTAWSAPLNIVLLFVGLLWRSFHELQMYSL